MNTRIFFITRQVGLPGLPLIVRTSATLFVRKRSMKCTKPFSMPGKIQKSEWFCLPVQVHTPMGNMLSVPVAIKAYVEKPVMLTIRAFPVSMFSICKNLSVPCPRWSLLWLPVMRSGAGMFSMSCAILPSLRITRYLDRLVLRWAVLMGGLDLLILPGSLGRKRPVKFGFFAGSMVLRKPLIWVSSIRLSQSINWKLKVCNGPGKFSKKARLRFVA